ENFKKITYLLINLKIKVKSRLISVIINKTLKKILFTLFLKIKMILL
ncbi:hypothetical protein CLOHIR_01537, partial [Peptacetobacter hiranonis DSM 13275]